MSDVHLDSRRLEQGNDTATTFGDYLMRFDDYEAVEKSPFRHTLEALRSMGFTELVIGHTGVDTSDEDINEWWVDVNKRVPATKPLEVDGLCVCASINEGGKRMLEICFGLGDYKEVDTFCLDDKAWGQIETIHTAISSSTVGRTMPMAIHEQEHDSAVMP